jgi:hypothetical protein
MRRDGISIKKKKYLFFRGEKGESTTFREKGREIPCNFTTE